MPGEVCRDQMCEEGECVTSATRKTDSQHVGADQTDRGPFDNGVTFLIGVDFATDR